VSTTSSSGCGRRRQGTYETMPLPRRVLVARLLPGLAASLALARRMPVSPLRPPPTRFSPLLFSPRYIDIRAALPCFPSAATAHATVSSRRGVFPPAASALTWIDLAEAVSELTPRYDKRGAPILSIANRIVARGASQLDCDSVDPSLPTAMAPVSGAASGGSGSSRPAHLPPPVGVSRSVVELWPGMPRTSEWEQASLRLNRAFLRGAVGREPLSSAAGNPAAATKAGRLGARASALHAESSAHAAPSCRRGALLSPGPVYASGSLAPCPQPRTLTLTSNSTWMLPALEHCVGRCVALLEAKAYLHWYERFGVTAEHIIVATESVQAVADAYKCVQRLP
jgi:hypothetical protein